MIFAVLLLGISLSIDALGMGISCSFRKIRISLLAKLMMCLISLGITGLSVVCGNLLTEWLSPFIGSLIGSLMLLLTGCFILVQAFRGEKETKPIKEKEHHPINISLRPLGITIQIIRNPVSCDLDGSSHIDLIEAAYLGLALSADSFGAGLGGAAAGFAGVYLPFAAASFQFIFLSIGGVVGRRILHLSPDSRIWTCLSGGILIVMAILRLFTY